MTFDWNLAKDTSMDNHPVCYVQYAHARERWILERWILVDTREWCTENVRGLRPRTRFRRWGNPERGSKSWIKICVHNQNH